MSEKPLQVKVKQAYQLFCIYGSIEPKKGENFSLFLPQVNTEMMNLYLEQMSQVYENEEIVVIMGQLGLYKSKDFFVPDNIAIICLPSYSLELNPIERWWKHMKTNYIQNCVFESLK